MQCRRLNWKIAGDVGGYEAVREVGLTIGYYARVKYIFIWVFSLGFTLS